VVVFVWIVIRIWLHASLFDFFLLTLELILHVASLWREHSSLTSSRCSWSSKSHFNLTLFFYKSWVTNGMFSKTPGWLVVNGRLEPPLTHVWHNIRCLVV
jgi:hypothetical protein